MSSGPTQEYDANVSELLDTPVAESNGGSDAESDCSDLPGLMSSAELAGSWTF